ncbi:MAG: polysaccharide deacetylase family protein [Lentisphaerae bacterium]|nr:polysaccharide deacetylase family protein [Lentisphaerota bacterium]
MTVMVPAYDVEFPGDCLAACRRISEVHKKHDMPGTFFVTGKVLEKDGAELKQVLDDPELFELASHTYSHKMFRDHPFCGPAASIEEIREEVFRGKQLVEDVFERKCVGLRPGCCFDIGLKHAPEVLSIIHEAGLNYVSTQAWGPCYTVPAPLADAYTYEEDGFGSLWEFPAHGWHENLLKGHNVTPGRLLLWPPVYPEANRLERYVQTPQEEFDVHRFFLDKALEEGREYVSLLLHPWSLGKFDPPMEMLDLLFTHARNQGLGFDRFDGLLAGKTAGEE